MFRSPVFFGPLLLLLWSPPLVLAQEAESRQLRPFKAPTTERILNPERLEAERDPWIDDTEHTTYRLLTWDDFGRRQASWSAGGAGLSSTVVLDQVHVSTSAGSEGYLARADEYRVYSLANKADSGYRPSRRGKRTLAHEQGHFDLAEICARTFRAELGSLSAAGASEGDAEAALAATVLAAYREVRRKLDQIQRLYDAETRDGRDRREQIKWDNTLRIALEGESTPVCSLL